MKERLNKMTRGETKVTVPVPESLSPISLANSIIYLDCRRRDFGLSYQKLQILTLIFSLGGKQGISASEISRFMIPGRAGSSSVFVAIQMKLKWLTDNGWVNRSKHDRWFYYTPAKKAINFFKVEKPAA